MTENNQSHDDSEQNQCPQCRSKKIKHRPLQKNQCKFCGNEWANISVEDIHRTVSEGDRFTLIDVLKQPITVHNIDGRTLTLEGKQGGEYKLTITKDGNGKLRRKKGPSERNQFGSKWTNPQPVEYSHIKNNSERNPNQ